MKMERKLESFGSLARDANNERERRRWRVFVLWSEIMVVTPDSGGYRYVWPT